jgi:hypothetical protein
MTKHTKRKKKTELPCQWVDEAGFDVVPKSRPEATRELPSDTAFLLKNKAAARPLRARGS